MEDGVADTNIAKVCAFPRLDSQLNDGPEVIQTSEHYLCDLSNEQ